MTGPVPPPPPPADAPDAATPPVRRGQPPTRRRHVGGIAIAAVAAAMALATACGGSTSDATPTATLDRPPTTTTSPNPTDQTTTTEPLTPKEQVKQAYLEITAQSFERLTGPRTDDPSVVKYHTDKSLIAIREELEGLAGAGAVARFPSTVPPTPQVSNVQLSSAKEASLTSCIIDDTQIVDSKTEEVIDDDVSSSLAKAGLVLEGQRWKLSTLTLIEKWDDAAGCDR